MLVPAKLIANKNKNFSTLQIKMSCLYNHDLFCFVCGSYLYVNTRGISITKPGSRAVEGYKNCFHKDPLERDENWSPSVVCKPCYTKITVPTRRIDIISPMEWSRPNNHPIDCYFCRTIIPQGTNKRRRDEIVYPTDGLASVKKMKLAGDDTGETVDSEAIGDLAADIDDVSILSPPAPNAWKKIYH